MEGVSVSTTLFVLLLQLTASWWADGRPIPVGPGPSTSTEFITKSCETTLYPQLCQKSLASYANKIQTSPMLLATSALSVTLSVTNSTSSVVKNLTQTLPTLNPIQTRAALKDCVEELGDSLYELQKSVREMAHIDVSTFEFQMDDIKTWVSAALTDDDTCMDGFAGNSTDGDVKAIVRSHIVKVGHLTSIALTFINNYATSG